MKVQPFITTIQNSQKSYNFWKPSIFSTFACFSTCLEDFLKNKKITKAILLGKSPFLITFVNKRKMIITYVESFGKNIKTPI